MHDLTRAFNAEITQRLAALDKAFSDGALDPAVEVLVDTYERGGVVHAFGTGHSEAFAMEIAGRAGGFIPTHHMQLKDLFLLGDRKDVNSIGTPELERDHGIADAVYDLYDIRAEDSVIIASNSGANGSTVGLALRAKAEGLKVVAVTSLEHSNGVTSKHPSGKRLFEVADVVIDNLAPYGDSTLDLVEGLKVGPVSSITAAYIAQLLTIESAAEITRRGTVPPMFISANIPGGDEHNHDLQEKYGARIRPHAYLER